MSKTTGLRCDHESLTSSPSPHAQTVGYASFSSQQVYTAATGSRKPANTTDRSIIDHFPYPLVLPEDDLATDPKYPPQSSASTAQVRNEITATRNVIYVAAVPKITATVKFMGGWLKPVQSANATTPVKPPSLNEITEYLQAFYHGITVRKFTSTLAFRPWSDESSNRKRRSSDTQQYVGLESGGSITRIRTRKVGVRSDSTPISAYGHQLNLNDILDHAISVLPADAYALLFLVDHDIFEDETDDFCCGRAYGGSRVAVVSSSQYNPCLDDFHGILDGDNGLNHVWPASHCSTFVRRMCQREGTQLQPHGQQESHQSDQRTGNKRKRSQSQTAAVASAKLLKELPARHKKPPSTPASAGLSASNPVLIESSPVSVRDSSETSFLTPMQAALQAHKSLSLGSAAFRSSTYALRVARTASHELGHCLGMDHCVYLACAMQGTCSLVEDARQPPYLCYVCERKLGQAVVGFQLSSSTRRAAAAGKDSWSSQVDDHRKQLSRDLDSEEFEIAMKKWILERHSAMVRFCHGGDKSTSALSKREVFQPLLAWSKSMLKIMKELR